MLKYFDSVYRSCSCNPPDIIINNRNGSWLMLFIWRLFLCTRFLTVYLIPFKNTSLINHLKISANKRESAPFTLFGYQTSSKKSCCLLYCRMNGYVSKNSALTAAQGSITAKNNILAFECLQVKKRCHKREVWLFSAFSDARLENRR